MARKTFRNSHRFSKKTWQTSDNLKDSKKEKRLFQKHLSKLHDQRKETFGCDERKKIEDEINGIVKQWNRDHNETFRKYDLHGMMVDEAEEYIQEIVSVLRRRNIKQVEVITGRGNHSTNNTPFIKNHLLTCFNGCCCDCQFNTHEYNDGSLWLRIH
ncbi:hypothetical protein GCK72_007696 [Caenorhabditis remanei]|uniref:Smr domain-containing protein n=1 Tax=Caenorhabditis remanei TaxID=31234 RepID=A0A6A5HN21_CAERE|nr:hypothetical protein GCK72_007696 [Caenorhabditis remanei]KAF1767737.1 hypothetical protein GCK72_007696 [Caenorhabditis remanei]